MALIDQTNRFTTRWDGDLSVIPLTAFGPGSAGRTAYDDQTGELFVLAMVDGSMAWVPLSGGGGGSADTTVEISTAVNAGQNLNATSGITLATGAAVSFTGSPRKVRLYVAVHGAIGESVNLQRPAPVVELWRSSDETLLATFATGYIRDSSDHEEASWSGAVLDMSAGQDPTYELRARRDSTRTGTVAVQAPSSISAEFIT